jgi:hypothetical protein
MITYLAQDLLNLGEEKRVCECPYCGKEMILDIDNIDSEYCSSGENYYHEECAYSATTCFNYLEGYLDSKEEWKEFFEWYYECEFSSFTNATGEMLRFSFRAGTTPSERDIIAGDYLTQNIEDFLRWLEDEKIV